MLITLLSFVLVTANFENIMQKEGWDMMPLTLANIGEENMIRRVGGKQEVKSILKI